MIAEEIFGTTARGETARRFTLAAGRLRAQVTDHGAALLSLRVPDRNGAPVEVCLGYDTLEEYEAGRDYLGATVGRCANRIAQGRLTLGGRTYPLAQNDRGNHLHGGIRGFDRYVWQAEADGDTLRLMRVSPDGEEGYPGALTVCAEYELTEEALHLRYRAATDRDTAVNLTNHTYFNLNGGGTVLGHTLRLWAERYLPCDEACLCTGELREVAGTPFDFRSPRALGERIDTPDGQLRRAGGYDHCFALSGGGLRPAAVLAGERSGIVLTVETSEPGVQLYTANALARGRGRGGAAYGPRAGVCLETQHWPDAPSHPDFPSVLLRPGEVYASETVWRFSTV